MLFLRSLRASYYLGTILFSYLWQMALVRVFRRSETVEGKSRKRTPEWLKRRKTRIDEKNAGRMLRAMLKLRGVFIKLGQVLSIMGGFLPEAYGKQLESLQDDVPPRPFEELRSRFRDGFDQEPEALFTSIEPEALAAASLGQVHVARDTEGRKLAVKVLYPGIRALIRVDMRVLGYGIWFYKHFVPIQGIERVHDALVDLLKRETNYLHEADCMTRMAKNFEGDDGILFPAVVTDRTTDSVLTMTFMEGVKITDFASYEKLGLDKEKVARRLVESFYEQLFSHRFFHADPHPGNFLVTDDNRLVVLDFGAVSEVPKPMIDGLLDVLRGFFEGNDALVIGGIESMGFMAPDGDRELLEKTVRTYFKKLLNVDRTAGALMRATREELQELADPEMERRELRELMKSVNYPDGWFYVERASVLMFWLVGCLAPNLDTLTVGMPHILPLLAKRTAEAAAQAAAERAAANQAPQPVL